jgi:hypothetical protein
VTIADALVAGGYVVLTEDGGEVTDFGLKFLASFCAELTSKSRSRRIFCRPCLDWSERRHHIAGLVGAEIWRRRVSNLGGLHASAIRALCESLLLVEVACTTLLA